MTTALPDHDRIRALLDERSASLAQRGADAASAVETREFLVCACGTECYGLALAEVAAVLPAKACTPVPGAPPALIGIVALSGSIVSVLDLTLAIGLPTDSARAEPGHFVHLRGQEPPVALAVDRVLGIGRIAAAEAATVTTDASATTRLGTGAISGYAPPGSDRAAGLGDGFSLVDLPLLLRRFLP